MNMLEQQIKLFDDSEVFQKERPTITEAQKEELYLKWAEHCTSKKWITIRYTKNELPEIFKHISLYTDAYEIAKRLEREKVLKINFEVCEWLNTLKLDYEEIIGINEIAWFRAHKFKFKFSQQSTIVFKSSYRCFNIGDLGKILLTISRGYYLVGDVKTNDVYKIPFEILEEIAEKN